MTLAWTQFYDNLIHLFTCTHTHWYLFPNHSPSKARRKDGSHVCIAAIHIFHTCPKSGTCPKCAVRQQSRQNWDWPQAPSWVLLAVPGCRPCKIAKCCFRHRRGDHRHLLQHQPIAVPHVVELPNVSTRTKQMHVSRPHLQRKWFGRVFGKPYTSWLINNRKF